MKLRFYLVVCVLSCFCSTQTRADGLQTKKLDGGSLVAGGVAGFGGYEQNTQSSLRRTWVILNDPTCPVQLSDVGVNPRFDRAHQFRPEGSVKATSAVRAFEIRHELYNVFGLHVRTLSSRHIIDLAADATYGFDKGSRWSATETEVTELLTVVSFVSLVRAEDGAIWSCNQKAIAEELGHVQLKVTGVFSQEDQNKK